MTSSNPEPGAAKATILVIVLLVIASVLSLAGTDLVLPAVPQLPTALGGTTSQAQLVLAAYSLGSGCGLLTFGALGARYDQRWVLLASLIGFDGLLAIALTAVATRLISDGE